MLGTPCCLNFPRSPGVPPQGVPSRLLRCLLSRGGEPARGRAAGDSRPWLCVPRPPAGGWSGVPGAVSLAEEYEEQYTESRVTGQTFRAAGHLPPDTPSEPSPRPPPAKRLEFVLTVSAGWLGRAAQPQHQPGRAAVGTASQAAGLVGGFVSHPCPFSEWPAFPPQSPSRRGTEEETTGTTTLGAQSPDASLSLPTSPDKQGGWTRAFPLPTVEEKQRHQSCSIQTNVVPINVSGRAALLW